MSSVNNLACTYLAMLNTTLPRYVTLFANRSIVSHYRVSLKIYPEYNGVAKVEVEVEVEVELSQNKADTVRPARNLAILPDNT